jgi:hypothetical protein
MKQVFFNTDSYPGFFYVKEISDSYKMFWVNYKTNKTLETKLELVDDNIYSVISPNNNLFFYEMKDNVLISLDKLEHEKLLNETNLFLACQI